MESVGNSITETDVAMELCKKVQVEECVIHVVGSTNFYTQLQFFLLASTWFPRPLGVCLWSVLHMFLVLYEALMLLVLFPIVFVLAVLLDAILVTGLICGVLGFPFMLIYLFLFFGFGTALVWLWRVITCECCTMPGRALGQGLGHNVCIAGGTLGLQDPQPAPVVEGGAAAADRVDPQPAHVVEGEAAVADEPWYKYSVNLGFVNHVILVSFPYRRAQLGDLCGEIVPWYDTIVI